MQWAGIGPLFFFNCKKYIDIYNAECIGVSSNGRTRDFGSLYHGSNPCAPTNKFNPPLVGFIYWRVARLVQIRFTFARQNIINVLYAFCSKMLVGTSLHPCVLPNQDKQHRPSGRFLVRFSSTSPSSKVRFSKWLIFTHFRTF